MADRILIVGPDGRRSYVQSVHCTPDNLRMVYNLPGDLFLEATTPDGLSELIFADRGRFSGLTAGVEYMVKGSAAPAAQAQPPQQQPQSLLKKGGVTFAPAAQPQQAPAPTQQAQQARQARQAKQAQPKAEKSRPGAYHPSSAEVEAILARTGGPLGGRGNPGNTGPVRMGGPPPGGAYGGNAAGPGGAPPPERQPLPMGPGIDGPGPGAGNIMSVGDFQATAGAPSGAGAATRPRSRGGFCAREGILPVSRGLRDAPWQGGGPGGGAARFEGPTAGGETTMMGTHTQTHTERQTGGVVPGLG